MKAYKGFDKNLRCQGFQYEVGKEYETDKVELCESGFHACENPLDVWNFYPPCNGNRFCEVEQTGDTKSDKTKTVSSKIKINAEIGIIGLVKAHVEWVMSKISRTKAKKNCCSAATSTSVNSASTNTGDRSVATNTGDWSASTNTGSRSASTSTGDRSASTNTGSRSASTSTGDWSASTNTGNWSVSTNTGGRSASTNTGDWSASTNTGDRSVATNTGACSAAMNTGIFSEAVVEGKESVAIVTGKNSKAKGNIGCWLVLTERDTDYMIIGMKAFRIDGKKYKPDTWYTLKNRKVVEVEDGE